MNTPLTCPACGGHTFTVGQHTWNTQEYDSRTDDWTVGEFYHESVYEIAVRCANEACERDCTAHASEQGWTLYHEHWIERRPAVDSVPLPRLYVAGQHGAHRRAHVTTTNGGLNIWRGTPTERCALCTIGGTIAEQIQTLSAILGMLLTEHERRLAARPAAAISLDSAR